MIEIWNNLKIWFIDHSAHQWVENHFLYFSIVGIIIIFFLLILIVLRINKDIKKIKQETNKSSVNFMRKTSLKNKNIEKD